MSSCHTYALNVAVGLPGPKQVAGDFNASGVVGLLSTLQNGFSRLISVYDWVGGYHAFHYKQGPTVLSISSSKWA